MEKRPMFSGPLALSSRKQSLPAPYFGEEAVSRRAGLVTPLLPPRRLLQPSSYAGQCRSSQAATESSGPSQPVSSIRSWPMPLHSTKSPP